MEIQIEFISAEVLSALDTNGKMKYILDHMKDDKILVIEEGMSLVDETALIEATMASVNKKFPGIEISTMRSKNEQGIREKLIRMLGGRTGGLTVIGPSKLIKKIKKDPRHITMLAGTEEDERKKKPKQ